MVERAPERYRKLGHYIVTKVMEMLNDGEASGWIAECIADDLEQEFPEGGCCDNIRADQRPRGSAGEGSGAD